MFEVARDGSWLDTIDIMLDIMTYRIFKLKAKYVSKNPSDIIVPIVGHLKSLYDASAGFDVIGINEEDGLYRIKWKDKSITVTSIWHDIDVQNGVCSCGKWQDREYPCINAMAFYRKHEMLSFE